MTTPTGHDASRRLARKGRTRDRDVDPENLPPIATRRLSKRYGDLVAVDNLDLEIQAGEYLNSEIFLSAKAQPGAGGRPALGLEWRRPNGFSWVTTWDNRFLPPTPSLDQIDPQRTRAFGTFLLWERRF